MAGKLQILLIYIVCEGDSSCVIGWVSCLSNVSSHLDVADEEMDLARNMKVCLFVVKRRDDVDADTLAKDGIGQPSLIVNHVSSLAS